jgi:hypothetical protein
VLADRIKKVQDSHLLELIEDVKKGETAARKFPPATAPMSFPRAAAAGANGNGNGHSNSHSNSNDGHAAHVAGSVGQAQVAIPFADHHGEQEDYLWGV